MGSVIDLPPSLPVDPIKCKGYECGGSTFFVYWDGHIICASCGLKPEYLGPLVDEEDTIIFDPDPILSKIIDKFD
tara:strand:+ start:16612 stop:16836 length:225 start_codon:yes stop_codon:yes gene_type:complete